MAMKRSAPQSCTQLRTGTLSAAASTCCLVTVCCDTLGPAGVIAAGARPSKDGVERIRPHLDTFI
eukprot:scaffold175_cov414-Prasinococcus_capsulatus_cf.AAC.3